MLCGLILRWATLWLHSNSTNLSANVILTAVVVHIYSNYHSRSSDASSKQNTMSEFLHCRRRSKRMKYLMDDTTKMKKHKNITVIHNIIKKMKLFFYKKKNIKNVAKANREEECCENSLLSNLLKKVTNIKCHKYEHRNHQKPVFLK